MATRTTVPPAAASTRRARQRPPFARSLLLPRVFALEFGLRDDRLLALLAQAEPGRDASGASGCARALAAQGTFVDGTPAAALARWDAAIARHEAAIGAARAAHALASGDVPQAFALTHFQWLACAVVEWHLEAIEADLAAHVARIDAFREAELAHLPRYTAADARKLACFMATGAGKTLVLHMNLRQFLDHGWFAPQNIVLLTSGEGMSAQHRAELEASGLGSLGVRVTEITKFYVDGAQSRRPKKGVSEATSRYEGPNLLLVDEGHKGGTSGGERDWRSIRETLAAGATEAQAGFTFEYSATFAQIADRDDDLYDEYARCISVDFGYARFWREGFGKQPRQINARHAAGTDFALVAGLLAFFQQRLAYAQSPALAHEYLIAPPLLACVGKDVTAGAAQSDVALLITFLARACADGAWLAREIGKVLDGSQPVQGGLDAAPLDLTCLRQHMADAGWTHGDIAAELARHVFGGSGRLSMHLVAPNELGLRSAGARDDAYFGVVRVGEAKKLADALAKAGVAPLGEPDRVAGSLFARLDADPRLSVLIGAKMFVEGWSSWRVSALGLMNVGRNPGHEIVQLFGRGVRLKGRGFSLKRDDEAPAPVQALQSLQVFGVRADYLQQFLDMLALEGVQPQVIHVPVTVDPVLGTMALRTLGDDHVRFAETVPFDPATVAPWHAVIDPAITANVGLGPAARIGHAAARRDSMDGWLDGEVAYQHALDVKRRLALHGLVFARSSLSEFLRRCGATAPHGWFDEPALGAARRAQAALEAVEQGLARAWRQAERRWRMRRLTPVPLTADNAGLPRQMVDGVIRTAWRIEIDVARGVNDAIMKAARDVVDQGAARPELLDEIQSVLARHDSGLADLGGSIERVLAGPELADERLGMPLPRLHVPAHLFAPILLERALSPAAIASMPGPHEQMPLFADGWSKPVGMTIRPPALNPGETKFLYDLRATWGQLHHVNAWRKVHLYVLRNPAAGGLRLYRESGFAPDFMLWLKRGDAQVLGLVDPKGLARAWPHDKLELIKDLEAMTLAVPVRGAIVTTTVPANIAAPPGVGLDGPSLWTQRVLLQSDADYLRRLLDHMLAALPTSRSAQPA